MIACGVELVVVVVDFLRKKRSEEERSREKKSDDAERSGPRRGKQKGERRKKKKKGTLLRKRKKEREIVSLAFSKVVDACFKKFLEDGALGSLFLGLFLHVEYAADGVVEDALEALLGEGGALDVLVGPELAREGFPLFVVDGLSAFLLEAGDGVGVVPEVELRAHEDEGHAGRVVVDFRVPLGANVLEGRGVRDGEAEQEDVRLRVRQGPQAVVVLLARRVPETQVDGLSVDHHVRRVIVKHRRNVLSGKRVRRVRDQQARFTDLRHILRLPSSWRNNRNNRGKSLDCCFHIGRNGEEEFSLRKKIHEGERLRGDRNGTWNLPRHRRRPHT